MDAIGSMQWNWSAWASIGKPRNAPIDCLPDGVDPYDYVLAANVHRRHLTTEQKRELIAKVLKAKPGESNRKIAKQTKADHKTVAAVRGDLESTGEIPQLEKTTGADGKQRKSRAKKKARRGRWHSDLDPATVGDACLVAELEAEARAAGSAEVSIEERKAEHAHLDDPIEEGCADCNTPQEDVADAATVEDSALYTLARINEHARVFKKIFKLSTFDREAEIRIGTAIERMIQKWRSTQAALTKRSHENVQGDIVEQCLSLIVAMNKEQRAQFFAKYTELSAARAPARLKSNHTNATD